MPRALRIALVVAVLALGLLVAVLAAAWFLMPKDWIDQEARRQAARIQGCTVRWTKLSPGLSGLSLGARIEGLYVRVPAEGEGDPRMEAKIREVFVSFRLLPLLVRRVEVAAARVSGAGIALTDRGTPPEGTGGGGSAAQGAGLAFILPRLDLDGIDIRTRDTLGGGLDIRRLSGRTEIDGAVDHPRAVRVFAKADSLFWKPSARDASVPLPSPLRAEVEAVARDRGVRLAIERGDVTLGPLTSVLSGHVLLVTPAGEPELALGIEGKPQNVRSSDEAFRGLAAGMPVAWSTTAAWQIQITGVASAPVNTGRVTLMPFSATSGPNTFSLSPVALSWNTRPDKSFAARVQAADKDLKMAIRANGSTLPGGATTGHLELSAPAARLNGLVPSAPTWTSGDLDVSAEFTLRAPSPPSVRWTAKGSGLGGSAPGLRQPISRMSFDLGGDERAVSIRSFAATVGSTTASLTGTVLMGKPLGTGTFRATLDRFIAEEWAPPPGGGTVGAGGKAAPSTPAAPPPIPLRSFDAAVSIGEFRSGTMTVRDLVAPVRFANGNLSVAPITGRIGTGSLSGGLELKNLVSTPSYALNIDVKRAPVEELFAGVLPFKLDLTGLVSGVVDLTGPGMPGAGVSDSLRGALSGSVEEGKLLETPTIAGLRKALGLRSDAQSGGALAFKTLTHSLRIDRGRLLLDKVKGDIGKDLFEMTGSMGLDRSLDIDLLLRLAPERIASGTALADLARFARDKDGRLPLSIKVTGTAQAPKISFKTSKTLEAAGSRLQQEIARGLAGAARKDSTRRAPADSARRARGDSAAADSGAVDDPVERAREALKRLLGK